MKKFFSTLLAATVGAVCCAGFSACTTTSPNQPEVNTPAEEGTLTIRYFEGGYGTEWLTYALKNFKRENEGFKYKLIPDNTITTSITTYLKSGKNLSDIYMTQGANWAEWVSQGYLANLNDVYESEVETSLGKKKVKDYMDDELVGRYYMQKYVGQGDYLPWVLPTASISCSFAYNEEMLLDTVHTTSREGKWTAGEKWIAPPETVEELLDYCADLNARGITPFSWAGQESHWLKFYLYTWFAQYQGVHEENLLNVSEGDGSYYDFWNFKTDEVWKMEGIQSAIGTLRSIFVDENAKKWKNSVSGLEEYSTQDAERAFVTGKSAMLIAGSFFYNEMKDYLDLDGDGKDDYTFKMMYIPLIENADRNADGTAKKITYYSTDEIMLVPAGAKNVSLAKRFLAYLCNEDNLLKFTQSTGTMRPFKYDPVALSGEFEWSPFTESVLNMYSNSDVRLYGYPAGKAFEDVSLIYRYKQPDVNGSVEWQTFVSSLKTLTPLQIMVTGNGSAYTSVYDKTKSDFAKWKIELGIED